MNEDLSWKAPASETHLFTVRIWVEEVEPGQREPRLQVRHVLTGETRYFRDAPAMLAYLLSKLDAPGS